MLVGLSCCVVLLLKLNSVQINECPSVNIGSSSVIQKSFTKLIKLGVVLTINLVSNSYTMGCPPVRGDNPRALASGLSYVQVDKHGITILYHLHQCRPCTSRDISC